MNVHFVSYCEGDSCRATSRLREGQMLLQQSELELTAVYSKCTFSLAISLQFLSRYFLISLGKLQQLDEEFSVRGYRHTTPSPPEH